MARPLRIDRADGWYHVTSRGIERREIFTDDHSRAHFRELLAQLPELFRVKIHAYVLMSNHYHLVLQTPEANLSRAVQWLNVSYVAWFNRRAQRVGPLMQGRFKSILVEDAAWAYELSLYVHLNPVMRKAYGLDKAGKKAEFQGLKTASPEEIKARLQALREYRGSSYRAYAGYEKAPDWLTTKDVLQKADNNPKQRVRRYRQDVKARLLLGADEGRAETLRDAFAVGSETFRAGIRDLVHVGREDVEPPGFRNRVTWTEMLQIIERVTGESSAVFMSKRGVVGKSLALWGVRRYGGLTLREAGIAAGGMDYTAVSMSIKRLEQRALKDAPLSRLMEAVKFECEM